MHLSSSVGIKGSNAASDVRAVQQYLKSIGYSWLKVDGLVGINTIKAIKIFQSRFMTHPDGRIDIGGLTLRRMTQSPERNIPHPPANSHPEWNRSDFFGRLTVSEGQVTFDAEGNDQPASLYFSRHIHWPGGVSGVTIGRGYDMGDRSYQSIISDFIRAGIDRQQGEFIASAYGKKGNAADAFVKSYRHACGIISRESQARLFELIYPSYASRARKIYESYAAVVQHATPWPSLHKAIREIIVDLVYQGLGYRTVLEPCMANDFDSLIHFIETDHRTRRYERGRQRANYLRRNRN
ncbi:EF hand domain protein [Pantoea sp. AS-PWVM4]|uniref:peptidoglycan-binding protein n=1 Tax=Pantoea sp. AS-PWVM4 TaxID=1332069 RepID=UPI0003AC7E0C|nr:peptidoglycan-binding protein [Pantoea sp. AS-PWVM4]ERK17016.1 EF hand domain protein [Pantoea sp. AS-PWVM4]